MAVSQINARIAPAIKKAGDAALADVGYTPTRAIRALWEFAGRNRGNEKELRKVLSTLEGKTDEATLNAETERRLHIAAEGPSIVKSALLEMGIEPAQFADETPYDELLEQALFEKLEERGLDR